jgi:hypothetical protein
MDTGAGKSFISEALLQTLAQNDSNMTIKPCKSAPMKSINGTAAIARNLIVSKVQIFGKQFTHAFYVLDGLPIPMIIGRDLMAKMGKLQFDFSQRMALTPAVINLCCDVRSTGYDNRRDDVVSTSEAVTIPPRTEKFLEGYCKRETDQTVCFVAGYEPLSQDKTILVARSVVNTKKGHFPVRVMNCSQNPVTLPMGTVLGHVEEVAEIIPTDLHTLDTKSSKREEITETIQSLKLDHPNVTQKQKKDFITFLHSWAKKGIFASSTLDLKPANIDIEHAINTGNHPPIHVPPRRIPFRQREVVDKMIQEMKDGGQIEDSHSQWASPICLVRKKNNEYRFCVDYRALNAITVRDEFPLPRIDDILDSLSGAKFFSTLDLISGYWQIKLKEGDKEKTAFRVPGGGHYQWKVLPFGLTNSPPVFMRAMTAVLAGLTWDQIMVYLDDVLCVGRTFEEHMERLQAVFERLHKANLRLKLSKCHFLQPEIPFLGHIVSAEGLKPDDSKVKAVKEMSEPKDRKAVRRFIGMCTFYRRFINKFSQICRPLYELTKESVKFEWTKEAQQAFDTLKLKLTTAPILAYPNFKKPFIIYTDASREGLGAILSQVDDNNLEHPVAYASRSLLPSETKYPVTELEGLALYWAVKLFRPYIYGQKFTVITDHLPLVYIFKNKTHDGRFAKWIANLSGMHFEIKYRPGAKHANVDALSRSSIDSAVLAEVEREVSELDLSKWEEHAKFADLALQQRNDSTLRARIEFLETGLVPQDEQLAKQFLLEKPNYLMKDGILVHLMKWSKNAEPIFQIVIPHNLRGEILEQCHNDAFASHFGVGKTFDKLAQRYYWDGYFHDAERYVKQCTWCARYKNPTRNNVAPMQKMDITVGPWERVGVDLLGPLPITQSKNQYIIVFTDYFTRWVEAVAIPNKEAQTVAVAFIREILCRYGACNELLSDRGKEFLNQMMAEVCKLCEIKKKNTTAYHPMTNGLTERFNKVLGTMLGIYVNKYKKDWDVLLPFILFGYRSSVQSTVKFSPHKILFGREPRIPGELSIQPSERQKPNDYAEQVAAGLKAMNEIIRNNLKEAQERQKKHYDKNKQHHEFPMDSLVWLQSVPKGQGTKLQAKWDGPYIIKAKPTSVDSVIRLWNQPTAKTILVHNNRLKPCFAPWQLPPIEEDDDDDIVPLPADDTARTPGTVQPTVQRPQEVNVAQQPALNQQREPADESSEVAEQRAQSPTYTTPPTSPQTNPQNNPQAHDAGPSDSTNSEPPADSQTQANEPIADAHTAQPETSIARDKPKARPSHLRQNPKRTVRFVPETSIRKK